MGNENSGARLSPEKVAQIRLLRAKGCSAQSTAKIVGCRKATVLRYAPGVVACPGCGSESGQRWTDCVGHLRCATCWAVVVEDESEAA